MRLKTYFVPTLLFIAVCVGPVSALEMIYPEDGTYIVRSDFIVIKGGSNPELDGLTVEINGLKSDVIDISSPEYKAVFGDFLILVPELAAGENSIRLEGISGGKTVQQVSAKVYFQKDPYGSPPAAYRPYVMHTPQKEALCAPCHNMQPTAAQLKESSAEMNPCASCHKSMLDRKNVHGPAGVYRCTYCHDPGSRPSKYKSRSGDAALCNECHLDKVKEFRTNRYVHGPVAIGMCSVCHDAHASEYPAQMHAPINAVCLGCHANLPVAVHFTQGIGKGHPVGGVPDPLANGRELSCASCHEPHGGATDKFFSEAFSSPMMLCARCHKK